MYRPENGEIRVPPTLVERVLAMGFSRTPPIVETFEVETSGFAPSSEVEKTEESAWVPPVWNDC